jgi:predicted alpha/beta-fold hydrolase
MREADFQPRGLLKNPHLQSVLASSALRRFLFRTRQREVLSRSREAILDCGDGVKLQAFHSKQSARPQPRGLVVVLHGWEGSAQSSYVLNTTHRLLREGYDVVRLNFRDHGETHHLNREIFHSCRIDEVVGAIGAIAREFPERPLFAMGYSLGGNFALRAALRAPGRGVPLKHVFAVCPAVRPHAILEALENGPWFYDAYFMQKWRRSLQRKAELFPDSYAFDDGFWKLSMRDLTSALIERYTDFGTLDAYLDGYSIHGDRLSQLEVPATVLTSRDDPVIPFRDFESLALPGCMTLEVARFGGHCGFIRDWSLESYAEQWLMDKVGEVADGGSRSEVEHDAPFAQAS